MEIHFAPEIELQLTIAALQHGVSTDQLIHEVLSQYLNDQSRLTFVDSEWTEEEERSLRSHIEEGYLQADRGELLAPDQVRRDLEEMKRVWRENRLAAQ